MIRKIIQIDEEKCNGCGACAAACHEGAIAMHDGKAKLIRDDYCDGLGNCLPTCPTGAITFVEREAAAYDEEAVKRNMEAAKINTEEVKRSDALAHDRTADESGGKPLACGCPGSLAKTIERSVGEGKIHSRTSCLGSRAQAFSSQDGRESDGSAEAMITAATKPMNRLAQWPVQIKLVPTNASYFNGSRLLIAADCTAYAYAAFHEDFIKGHITVVGCPKLDDVDYTDKLTEIISNNDIRSVKIVRMEVPCCGGIEYATKNAIKNSGKFIEWQVVTISTDGRILD